LSSDLTQDEGSWMGLRISTWFMIAVLSVLAIATFRFNLVRLYHKTNPFPWNDDPLAANWGHSFFVPLIGLYYLYLNREELARTPKKPLLAFNFSRFRILSGLLMLVAGVGVWAAGTYAMPATSLGYLSPFCIAGGAMLAVLGTLVLLFDWGIGLLLFGLLVFMYGIHPGKNDWTSDMGIPISIFGAALTMFGWPTMRIAWFPIVFLICAIPWPQLVYSKVASPLQELAASIAVNVLTVCGIETMQAGTKIIMSRGLSPTGAPLPDRVLNVAEACAGMRSLMTFISVGAAMAFLSSRALWQKLVIALSAIPIAIFCNVMRVSGQGLLDRWAGEEWSEGFAHAFVGLVMLIPAFFLLLGVQWLLDKIFVEEVDEEHATPGVIRVGKKQAASPAIETRHDLPRRSARTNPGESA
jgi:exosortase